jgi:3-deoxy-D-manno-octulosonic-acid transferase
VYWAYSALLLLVLLLSAPWWLWQMLRYGKYRAGWSERFGSVPKRLREHSSAETIWIHAVSVGEVLAMTQIIADLQSQLPGWRIVVSTTTDTGQKLARQRFGEENVFRAPLDLPWAVQAFIDVLRPRMLVLAESEFWPNLLHIAHNAGIKIAVVNARVSDRSLPRYLRFRGLLRRVLSEVDLLLAQTDEDGRRLVAIGAPAERVQVGGNLKFDVKPPQRGKVVERLSAAVQQGNVGPIIIAGSTVEAEEAILGEAFLDLRQRYPQALLVLAPRHPERFEAVATLVASSELPLYRRSRWDEIPFMPTDGMSGAPEDSPLAGGVLLLDSIGELAGLYELADIAFVGGSLVPRGGHNILEPAHFGVPILVGPYTENFRDIIEIFRQADAVRVLELSSPPYHVEALAKVFIDLLESPGEREALGRNARSVLQAYGGATDRTVDALLALLSVHRVALVETTAERQA